MAAPLVFAGIAAGATLLSAGASLWGGAQARREARRREREMQRQAQAARWLARDASMTNRARRAQVAARELARGRISDARAARRRSRQGFGGASPVQMRAQTQAAQFLGGMGSPLGSQGPYPATSNARF